MQLGLIKDLRRGERRISGYTGTLQLAKHTRTGLLLLCVSQFGANVTERHRKFAVCPEVIPKRTPKKDKRTVSIPCRGENSIPNGPMGTRMGQPTCCASWSRTPRARRSMC